MPFLSAVVTEVEHIALPLPIAMYPLIAAVFFLVLGIVVWSFREVANRHSAKAKAYAAAHGGYGGGSGAGGH